MNKTAHLLTTLLFTMVCGALWYVWRLAAQILAAHLAGAAPTPPMAIALLITPWIFLLPAPAIVYSAVLMDRVDLPVEKVNLYFVVVATLSAGLILATVILFGMEAVSLHGSLARS